MSEFVSHEIALRQLVSRWLTNRFTYRLATILEKRCAIAPSYAQRLVEVMKELQRRRQATNVFAGKGGFITPRDLFRWAERGAVGYQQLAEDGFCILGERLRNDEERRVVQEVLEKVLKVSIDMEELYRREGQEPVDRLRSLLDQGSSSGDDPEREALAASLRGIVWTRSMARVFTLVDRCLRSSEPVLLVGETGTGKTTVCQLLAFMRGQRLQVLNCNQHTETSDFLGGFRPTRDREAATKRALELAGTIRSHPWVQTAQVPDLPPGLAGQDLAQAVRDLVKACEALLTARAAGSGDQDKKVTKKKRGEEENREQEQAAGLRALLDDALSACAGVTAPFQWVDGPLIESMKAGSMILVDELNLADDAVLER